jgi:hypothetical protein
VELTIQHISNRHAMPIAEARPNSTETLKSSLSSFEEHLSRQASIRPLVGASLRGRQFAAIPNPVPQDVAASSATQESSTAQNAQPLPFYVANPYHDPTNPLLPEMIRDLTATATPQFVKWTSRNGLTTTGIMNPFGLTKNNPGMGFYGAEPNTSTR